MENFLKEEIKRSEIENKRKKKRKKQRTKSKSWLFVGRDR